MAKLRVWEAFDLRAFDFRAVFHTADRTIQPTGTTMGAVTYPTAVIASDGTRDGTLSMGHYGTGLTFDPKAGQFTGGTVQAIYKWLTEPGGEVYYKIQFRGFTVDAARIGAVMETPGLKDDRALLDHMLRGADTLTLSRGNDWVDGGGGDDTINGGTGDDTLLGGPGNDRIEAMSGRDRITGGTGNDHLWAIKDRMADVFVFNGKAGADTVVGFEDGIDRIEITSGATSFRQVKITDSGADARVTFGDTSILITKIDHKLIGASDFLFT